MSVMDIITQKVQNPMDNRWRWIQVYRRILHVRWKPYKCHEPRYGYQHKGYIPNQYGHALSSRYHLLYQERHIVQAKHLQVIYSRLGVLKETAPKFDRCELRIWNENTRQSHRDIKFYQYLNAKTITLGVSACINNWILQIRSQHKSGIQQYFSRLLEISETSERHFGSTRQEIHTGGLCIEPQGVQ